MGGKALVTKEGSAPPDLAAAACASSASSAGRGVFAFLDRCVCVCVRERESVCVCMYQVYIYTQFTCFTGTKLQMLTLLRAHTDTRRR